VSVTHLEIGLYWTVRSMNDCWRIDRSTIDCLMIVRLSFDRSVIYYLMIVHLRIGRSVTYCKMIASLQPYR
jgi:hypothetical protein